LILAKTLKNLHVYRKRKVRVLRVIFIVLVMAAILAAVFWNKTGTCAQAAGNKTAAYASLIATEAKALWTKVAGGNAEIARVDGKAIAEKEFDRRYNVFLFVKGIPVSYKDAVDKKLVLEQIINEEILVKEAAKQGIAVTDEKAKETLARAINESSLTEELLNSIIKSRKITEKDLEAYYKRNLIIIELLNKTVDSKIAVTEQDMKNFYNETKERYSAKAGEIRARQIVVNSTEEASRISKALKNNSEFTKEAYYYSLDRESAVYGGDLGFINNETLPKQLSEVAFSLKEGQTSPAVNYNGMYYIFRRENNVISYDEIKPEIKTGLENSMKTTLMVDYINKLRKAAKVEYFRWANQSTNLTLTATIE
jgi:peptidyl-prolyl cis-trans isomerase C